MFDINTIQFEDEFALQDSDQNVSQYMQIAAAALVAYDVFLTIDEEVYLVWKRPWKTSTFLYFMSRYGTLAHASLAAAFWKFPGFGWSTLAMLVTIESLLVLRVYAMYGSKASSAIPLGLLFVATTAAMCALEGLSQAINVENYLTPAALTPTTTCISLNASHTGFSRTSAELSCYLYGDFPGLVFTPSLLLETVLFGLTLNRTVKHLSCRVNTPLLTVLVRDGVLHYAVIFSLILVNVTVSFAAPVELQSLLSEMVICMSSSLSARIFLNLRHTLYGPEEITEDYAGPEEARQIRVPDYDSWCTSTSDH